MPSKKPREPDQLRPVKIKRNQVKYAEGSALIEMGDTKVLCAATVEKGRPRWMKDEDRGWITAEYSLLPRSTNTRTRRERGKISGRTQEIQRLIGRSLRASADLSRLGNHTVTVDCDVLQADGGTRTASITGAYVALYDAVRNLHKNKVIDEFPLAEMVAAISVGYNQGALWLDLDYALDSTAEVDMNVVMTGSGEIIEIQGTAEGKNFSRKQLDKMVDLAWKGISELIQAQNKCLRIKGLP